MTDDSSEEKTMIKFAGSTGDGRKLIGIGLSAGNVKNLQAGQPIHIHLEELGLTWKGDIIVMYGETEQSLRESLSDLITPQTVVTDESKKKEN